MLAPRLAPAVVVLAFAVPAFAQPSNTPSQSEPASEAPAVEASASIEIAAPQEPDTDVAPTTENVESPTRVATVTGGPSMAVAAVPPEAYLPPPPPPRAPLAANRDSDAAAGRAYLTPTAITGPKGSGSVELIAPTLPGGILTAKYALTDRIEIGAGAAFVLVEDGGAGGVLTAKVQVIRRPTGAVAVQMLHVSIPDEDDSVTFWSLVGSKCLDASCRTLGTVHLTLMPFTSTGYSEYDYGSSEQALAVIPGLSVVSGGRTKVVFDAVMFGDDGDIGIGLYGGVRFARSGWAADVGLIAGSDGDDSSVLPVPFVGLTARF